MKKAAVVLLGAAGVFAAWFPTVLRPLQSAGGASIPASGTPPTDWPVYGGQAAGDHYSALKQINRDNVKQLQVAWTFDSGEHGQLQSSPIIVGGVLYSYTPSQKIIALDGGTGKLLWTFDSGIAGTQPARGLAYWTDGTQGRILAGVMNFLYALDAKTGKPVADFGEGGRVDLREHLGRDPKTASVALTSPGIVYKDLIIVGGRLPETLPAPPGDVRAYDVRTGALRWSFHTIPHPGEFGSNTWPRGAWQRSGAANNWAGMSLDRERGIVYVPTGSAAFDFYGGDRQGDDLFANSLLALKADTGERIWHFQGVHHDLWDRDFPSPPALLTVQHDGKSVDAVAQTTKQGWVYLFNRLTGEPLFPIEEKPYPASTVPGETAAHTQPLPTRPAPFARQELTAQMLTTRTPEAHAFAAREFARYQSAGQFVPPAVGKQTVVFPGYDGGAEWGGPAVDPQTGILYVNANEMAWASGLVPNESPQGGKDDKGRALYGTQCSVCHGSDRTGSPPAFPSLVGVGQRLSPAAIKGVVQGGRGRMPAFPNIADDDLAALVQYLQAPEGVGGGAKPGKNPLVTSSSPGPFKSTKELPSRGAAAAGTVEPYHFSGYHRFLDQDGYPAVEPPWGTLSAINLNTGEYAWKIPLGGYPELAAKGMADTGSENYGGPVVTAGGVLFIAATVYDRQIRAFDSRTGALLWQATLPVSATATPATYAVDGRQYVVIAAGGGKDPKGPSGGLYIAFALPRGAAAAGEKAGR